MLEFGYAQEDITPKYGAPLCGYLNPRPNRGALDRLKVKAAALKNDAGLLGALALAVRGVNA